MERKATTLLHPVDTETVLTGADGEGCIEARLQLEVLLEAEVTVRLRLQRDLELRNCALNAAASHFLVLDMQLPGWPIVFANRSALRDYGYGPDEVLGRSAVSFIDGDASAIQLEQINEAMRIGRECRTELRAKRKDGSTFWSGVFVGPVHDNSGNVTHYVLVGADITQRLEDEQNKRKLQDRLYSEMQERERMGIELRLAQKLEAVGRLAAGVAHEINTPIQYVGDSVHFLQSAVTDLEGLLSSYRGAFQALAGGAASQEILAKVKEIDSGADLEFLSAEVPKAFERTLEGVERVAGIVRAMKEFAHPDANEHSPADINHAIETTLTVARNEYKYAATVEAQLGHIPEVVCSISELNQVFLNLIVNAAHAIAESGKDVNDGRITITTGTSGDLVTVTIADNGCGIPEQNLDKIFDPFFTTKEVGKGTGQGLAIARSIVAEKHAGSIEVKSDPGHGTRFVIRLPIAGRQKGKLS
jgi:PAS domain S-box-containing protein